MPVRPLVAITYEIRTALNRYYGAPVPSLTTAPADFKPMSVQAAVAAVVTQRMAPAKPPPPVPKKPPVPSPNATGPNPPAALSPSPPETRSPIILVLNAPERFPQGL